MSKAFFMDLTRCTACRGCQIACKQWHKLPAEKTVNWGSRQNPKDLSFVTYKLVRFSEKVEKGQVQFLFFPDQCRHCFDAPCKIVCDSYNEEAIIVDEATNAVLFTEHSKALTEDEKVEVLDSCPYNIPRWDKTSGIMGKCDMCNDRVINGLKPACVGVCPTGAMNFGDREDIVAMAEARLKVAKKRYPKASLVDKDAVNVIILTETDPASYHEYLMADASPAGINRKQMFAKMFKPLRSRA